MLSFSAQQNGRMNTSSGGQGKQNQDRQSQPWPPWRLPAECDPHYQDPRALLHSKYAHGLIFNLLHKAVHNNAISENITSLSVFLLELALSLPQTQYSGQELAVSSPTPWYIVHEPVDLQYDTWYPTDYLSANLRHTVSAIFSNQPSASSQTSMEVDQVSEGSSDESDNPPYNVETPSSIAPDGPNSPPIFRLGIDSPRAIAMTNANQSALVLRPQGAVENVRSLVPSQGHEGTTNNHTRALLSGREIMTMNDSTAISVNMNPSRSNGEIPEQSSISVQANDQHRSVVSVNESIISLLLKLHSKASGRPDSYTPLAERKNNPTLRNSTTQEYIDSRIGDGCFFIEKVLDKICSLDSACEQFIKVTRTQLWPTNHAREAEMDVRLEQEEAEARKRRAQERKARLMRDFADRQHKFMESAMKTAKDEAEEEEVEADTSNIRHEYYCVHCHQSQASTEDKPMGLVVLLQATSVLGHKHRDSEGLVLPTSPEERSALAVEDSLAAEYEARFEELGRQFDPRSHLVSVNTGWQGGVFVQSCGHHVHMACHQSYQQSLRGTGARPSSQTLAVDKGEYMCPMCRQLANSVLPIPPDMEGQVVRSRSQCPVVLGHEVTALLKEPPFSQQSQQSALMQVEMETGICDIIMIYDQG